MGDVNSTTVVESTGKYVVALSGIMIPGEVFVNGDLIFSFYAADDADATVVIYAVQGDTIGVVGAEHSIRKVEYV